MSTQKVAVVTGSNKGIGFAIVKGLCERFNGVVYLTSRDKARGEAAVSKLKELGLNPSFHQLDVDSQDSVNNFRDYLKKTHGGIDILINNVGIAFTQKATEPLGVQAELTMKTNYYGTLRACEALFPLLRNNARVVHLSSSVGFLGLIQSEDIKAKFRNPNLTIPQLTQIVEQYIQDAKDGNTDGYVKLAPSYSMSKIVQSAMAIIQQRQFDKEQPERNIAVNHVHPGYVATDLNSHSGPLTTEEGAKSALFAALDTDVKGQYIWLDCQIIDWFGEKSPGIF